MAVRNATPSGAINGDQASTILNADLANIQRKVKEGRTLTGPERQYFISIQRGDANPSAVRHVGSIRELADAIGCHRQTIYRALRKRGNPGRRPDNAYDIGDWARYLQAAGTLLKSAKLHLAPGQPVNGESVPGDDLDHLEARVQHERVRTELTGFKLAVLRGDYLPTKQVEQKICAMILNAKRQFQQIVTLAPQIVGISPVEAKVMLQEAIDHALDQLSANPFGDVNGDGSHEN